MKDHSGGTGNAKRFRKPSVMILRILPVTLLILDFLSAAGPKAADLAKTLPPQPCGIGRPASDRRWWGAWAKTPEAAAALKRAEASLKTPLPPFDAERYLDYQKDGDRSRYQEQHTRRWNRFKELVLGECLEDKGRFLAAIDESVRSLCADPSWVLPAHDRDNQVFKGGNPYADLAAASNGYQMALAAWLLDGRLPAATIDLMRANVTRRLTGPVLRTIDGTAPKDVLAGHWWTHANHNWNAVCTAGAVGAILASEPSRETRAKAVEWAALNMKIFLSGFPVDGYCSEGLGYWNYGFGHFVVLAEVLRAQTGGQVDLLKSATVRRIAEAPAMLEIANGIYPAFADCPLTAKPEPRLLELVRWRLENRPFTGSASGVLAESPTLYQTLADLVARRDAAARGAGAGQSSGWTPPPLRSWFAESGVCVVRPARAGGLAAAWKGGHNAENHHHNDVGTTVVVWRGRAVLADPGAMVYRAETFSRNRYKLTVMGSYAHSVPVVAGFLQAEGNDCRGQVLATEFTDARDTMTIDMASAYPASGVKNLLRQWIYQRDGDGSLVIEDRFAFAKPSTFATALTGFGTWYLIDGNDHNARFLIDGGNGAVLEVDVAFSANGKWRVGQLDNPGKPTASRLGLALAEPAQDGFVKMTVRPAADGLIATSTQLAIIPVPVKLDDERKAPPEG